MSSSVDDYRMKKGTRGFWRSTYLIFLYGYAGVFVLFIVYRSVLLSAEYGAGSRSGGLWGLKQGWILNRAQDMSDTQWRNFRQNLPLLSAVMAVFTFLGHSGRASFRLRAKGMSWFWLVISSAYIMYLHGACFIFVMGISIGNYMLVKTLGGTRTLPAVLWSYNLMFLVSNRVYEGYSFKSLGQQFEFLDSHRGMLRWQISFNLGMLRMVSFGLDYHWACMSQPSTIDWEKHTKKCTLCQSGGACYLAQQEKALTFKEYNLVAYLSYILYAPLYLAGPIISFNAFASQLETPQKTYSRFKVLLYGLRWLACLGLVELMTHFCYYNSFAVSGMWQRLSPLEICIVGYGVLNFMWLKFLLIWRFFRLFSLLAGIEAPENMLRCVNNSYDLEGFWKSWHASYNRWLVRYLYIQLGGARWRLINVWVIFTFVALWHDLEWKLLSWAWVTCLLWAPELCVKSLMKTSQLQGFKKSPLFVDCCAIAGAFNITGLMVANLVGFVVGPSGIQSLASILVRPKNIPLFFSILTTFYVGCKVMFHVRELETNSSVKQGKE